MAGIYNQWRSLEIGDETVDLSLASVQREVMELVEVDVETIAKYIDETGEFPDMNEIAKRGKKI